MFMWTTTVVIHVYSLKTTIILNTTMHAVISLILILLTYAQGERVPERDFHVATVVKNRIVVFGGRSDVFAPYFTANDIYPSDFFYYELGEYFWSACIDIQPCT